MPFLFGRWLYRKIVFVDDFHNRARSRGPADPMRIISLWSASMHRNRFHKITRHSFRFFCWKRKWIAHASRSFLISFQMIHETAGEEDIHIRAQKPAVDKALHLPARLTGISTIHSIQGRFKQAYDKNIERINSWKRDRILFDPYNRKNNGGLRNFNSGTR